MKRVLGGLLVVGLLGIGVPAFAGDGSSSASHGCAICEGTKSDSWGVKTATTLTRGVANTALCWTELAHQPMKEVRNHGNFLVGVGKGIGHTLVRGVKGVAEIITSPLPKAKDGSQIATDCPVCMWNT